MVGLGQYWLRLKLTNSHPIYRFHSRSAEPTLDSYVRTGIPHDKVSKHSELLKRWRAALGPVSLSGLVLGPHYLDQTVPRFYQTYGVIDSYYIVRHAPDGTVGELIPFVGRKRWRIDRMFQQCQSGDLIVAQCIF
jgi:hypothetical protein